MRYLLENCKILCRKFYFEVHFFLLNRKETKKNKKLRSWTGSKTGILKRSLQRRECSTASKTQIGIFKWRFESRLWTEPIAFRWRQAKEIYNKTRRLLIFSNVYGHLQDTGNLLVIYEQPFHKRYQHILWNFMSMIFCFIVTHRDKILYIYRLCYEY